MQGFLGGAKWISSIHRVEASPVRSQRHHSHVFGRRSARDRRLVEIEIVQTRFDAVLGGQASRGNGKEAERQKLVFGFAKKFPRDYHHETLQCPAIWATERIHSLFSVVPPPHNNANNCPLSPVKPSKAKKPKERFLIGKLSWRHSQAETEPPIPRQFPRLSFGWDSGCVPTPEASEPGRLEQFAHRSEKCGRLAGAHPGELV